MTDIENQNRITMLRISYSNNYKTLMMIAIVSLIGIFLTLTGYLVSITIKNEDFVYLFAIPYSLLGGAILVNIFLWCFYNVVINVD